MGDLFYIAHTHPLGEDVPFGVMTFDLLKWPTIQWPYLINFNMSLPDT